MGIPWQSRKQEQRYEDEEKQGTHRDLQTTEYSWGMQHEEERA